MSAPATSLDRRAARAARFAPYRALGLLGMLGSPAFVVSWLAGVTPAGSGAPQSHTAKLLDLVYLAGWACSVVALRRLRITGRGRGAATIFGIQVAGLLLAASQEVQDLAGRRPLGDAFYHVADAAWPLSHLFMLVVGAAVLRARVWTGWRRWTPLACGLVLPAMFASAALGGPQAAGAVFSIGTAAAFFALGLAVFRGGARDEV